MEAPFQDLFVAGRLAFSLTKACPSFLWSPVGSRIDQIVPWEDLLGPLVLPGDRALALSWQISLHYCTLLDVQPSL